jgi:hypothetical protein
MPHIVTIPLHNRQRSTPMTSERSTPQIPAGHNQTNHQRHSQRAIIPYTWQQQRSMGLRDSRNLFLYRKLDGMGGHPAQPKLARLQNPDTPLYLEKPVIWPLYQCQYWDVTILCFCVRLSLTIAVL